MRVTVVTIFPDLVKTFVGYGLLGKAIEKGLIEVDVVDLRDFTQNRHRTVDDTPFGGGGGMVLCPEPLFGAVEAKRREGDRVILLSPQGRMLTHEVAAGLSKAPGLVLICGRYEGVDERIRQALIDEDISIGDYVLMGGELPALVLLEAVARLVPDVIGNRDSVEHDSFAEGILDCPVYTRPASFRGMEVPETLVSGNHAGIARWRRNEALRRTLERRPDLLERVKLSEDDSTHIRSLRQDAGLAAE